MFRGQPGGGGSRYFASVTIFSTLKGDSKQQQCDQQTSKKNLYENQNNLSGMVTGLVVCQSIDPCEKVRAH